MLPETTAGRRAAWLLDQLRAGARDLTLDAMAEHIALEDAEPAEVLTALRQIAESLGDAELAAATALGDRRVALTFRRAGGPGAKLTLETGDRPPWRVRRMWVGRAPPEDVEVRPATRADERALRDLELRAPLQGASATAVERLGDPWESAALMRDPALFIAHRAGEPAGLIAVAVNPARVGGDDLEMLYVHRARVLPAHQRQGIGSALVDAAMTYAADRDIDTMYWYLGFDNEVSQAFASGVTPDWSVAPRLLVLRCGDLARDGEVARATPADGERIAAVLNASHEGEELYRPYTADSLAERLARSPALYGWRHLALGDAAVLGVRGDGARTRVHVEREGRRSASTRAPVLDFGCMPGAEDEFEALLRRCCASLAAEGVDEVSVMVSPRAHLHDRLRALAADVREYRLRTAGVREPPGGLPRGVYADHAYL